MLRSAFNDVEQAVYGLLNTLIGIAILRPAYFCERVVIGGPEELTIACGFCSQQMAVQTRVQEVCFESITVFSAK